jgi:hypothetical protein
MQQGGALILPKPKEDPMRMQVKGDLEKFGVPIARDMKIYETQKELLSKPGVAPEIKKEILQDLATILRADIKLIEEKRATLPGFQINERNPEYKSAMDSYVAGLEKALKGVEDNLGRYESAPVASLGNERLKDVPKKV